MITFPPLMAPEEGGVGGVKAAGGTGRVDPTRVAAGIAESGARFAHVRQEKERAHFRVLVDDPRSRSFFGVTCVRFAPSVEYHRKNSGGKNSFKPIHF